MKPERGYGRAVGAYFSIGTTCILSFFFLQLVLIITATAQDSLQLKSFTDRRTIYSYPLFTYVDKSDKSLARKKSVYDLILTSNLSPDTAAINARYRQSLNPLLSWRYAYPRTPDEMERRIAEEERKAKIGNQVASGVFNNIFRRNEQIAVKPTF